MSDFIDRLLEGLRDSAPTTVWTAVAAIATVVTAIAAVWTLVALRHDSRDRSRPVMVAELRPAVLSDGVAELLVSNLGQSVAFDVRVEFDPEIGPSEATTGDGAMAHYLANRYSRVIGTFAPGMLMTNVYQFRERSEPVPDDVTVTITYKDSRDRQYVDAYELSMSTIHDATTIGGSTAPTDERSSRALEALARRFGRK